MFNDKSIAITGGTGTFGRKFAELVLQRYKLRRLIIFSRDELKQYEMAHRFSPVEYPEIRYFIGDVRDMDRLKEAFRDVDYVIHAAGMKQVFAAEYNPFEAIKTNVLGAQNVIRACIACGVRKAVALSTDKAGAPISLCGATKLCSDKLFIAGNAMSGGSAPMFSVVRYGNVFDATDGVVSLFLKQRNGGILTITDPRMTRFSITQKEAVEFVLKSMLRMKGGEIFIPRIPSYRIADLAKAIAPMASLQTIGMRQGERLNEVLIPEDESWHTVEYENHYQILPVDQLGQFDSEMCEKNAKSVPPGFTYRSNTNPCFLSVEELKKSILQSHPHQVNLFMPQIDMVKNQIQQLN